MPAPIPGPPVSGAPRAIGGRGTNSPALGKLPRSLTGGSPGKAGRRLAGAAWLFGLLTFAAVIAVVAGRGEIAEVTLLLRRTRLAWLVAALALQVLTYILAAAVWQLALARHGGRHSLRALVPLALAMLFSNQAVPSVGLSGGLVVSEALVRRGTPRPVAMSALLVGLVTTYAALLAALALALFWLGSHHALSPIVLAAAGAFTLLALGVTLAILEATKLPRAWKVRLSTWPVVGPALAAATAAPTEPLRDTSLMLTTTGLQFAQVAIDAATLYVSLLALGWSVAPGMVFCSFVLASVGSRVAFAPLGIGTFEAGAVMTLHLAGLPLEPALAATLIFRGLTLWLPMAPGLWYARRALGVA